MTAILNFSKSLLDLGRTHVANRQSTKAVGVLQKLIGMPDVAPKLLAEANYAIGQIQFDRSEYESAEDYLVAALDFDEDHADANYLLARTMEKQSGGADEMVVQQYRQATTLAPDDAVRKSAYGRALVAYDRSDRGAKILRQTFTKNKSNPAVVEEVLHGLVAGRHYEDAEKVLRHATKQKESDPRFQTICREFNRRRLKENWPRKAASHKGQPYVVAFPATTNRAEPVAVAKETGKRFRVVAAVEKFDLPKVAVDPDALLLDLLDRSSAEHLSRIADTLGCNDSDKVDISNAIARKLENSEGLRGIVQKLPADSKKLLRTLIRVGGVVPATVLEQNDPERVGPHPAQALSDAGLIFVGTDSSKTTKQSSEIAIIPSQLHKRLAKLNRIKVGVRQ